MAVNQEPTEMFDVYSDDVTIKDLTIRDVYYHGVHMRGENDVDRTHLQNLHTINRPASTPRKVPAPAGTGGGAPWPIYGSRGTGPSPYR